MTGLFKYSGNKSRLLKYYRTPPAGTKRIVEPYLGSGSAIMASKLPGLGFESNTDLVTMWKWLQRTTPSELNDLNQAVEDLKLQHVKPDVRLLDLDVGPQTYVRINVTGVYTGQLTAWKIYPQHKLPIASTIQLLPRLTDVEVRLGTANDYIHQEGDMLFVDPPYLGTIAGYNEKSGKKNHEKSYCASHTVDLIAATSNPVIFTYGDGAATHFPSYDWTSVVTRKVPNIRRGGTVDRTEWVSYINWPA
jgi:site-specific DNA-adenine methylase